MQQAQTVIEIETHGQGLYDISAAINSFTWTSGLQTGLLTLFIRHTSASLTIQENADPDVKHDLTAALGRLAPEDTALYRHTCEGPDDMPAHVKAALTDVSLSIPVMDSRPVLGTWQGIYVMEHRRMAHRRSVVCHLLGE